MTGVSAITAALQSVATATAPTRPSVGGGSQSTDAGFTDIFRSAMRQANDLDTKATKAVTGLLSGDGVEVHDAMIATQKAGIAFELALQVRNKAVSAYQQMMQMQF